MKHFVALALAIFLSSSIWAQDKAQTETQVNSKYRTEINEYLQQDILKRQKLMNEQARKTLINLPNEYKLYDENFIKINASIEEGVTEEGKAELNFVFDISYNCNHIESVNDDYPIGLYKWDQSNSCRALCSLTKKMAEGVCRDIFAAGNRFSIYLYATTDAVEVSHIPYKGEFGDFRYCPTTFNGEEVRISVSQAEGISNNAQLAYIRAQSVKDYLDKNVSCLRSKGSDNEYHYVTKSFGDTGSHYRRSAIRIVVHGAFDAKADEMNYRLTQDEFVDYNIPVVEAGSNNETFAVIIANEDYTTLPNVPYALNDGNVMREYFLKTLGIPERHLKQLNNATAEDIKMLGIEWLRDITIAVKGKANIIVYFAGHGFSDADGHSYIVPVNVDYRKITTIHKYNIAKEMGMLSDEEEARGALLTPHEVNLLLDQCIALDSLAGWFNKVQSQSITFLIDASLDGRQRNGEPMIAHKREPNYKKPKAIRSRNNSVFFTSAAANRTSYSFEDQHHGFFTYFMLKELKRTVGDINYKDFFENVERNLSYESSLQGKLQQPIVTPGSKVKEMWQDLHFRPVPHDDDADDEGEE